MRVRLLLRALGAAALVVVAGCGASSHASSTPTSVARTAAEASATTTSTTVAPTPAALSSDEEADACRALVSFGEYLDNVAEDGPDAAGQIGGMVQDVTQAMAEKSTEQLSTLKRDLSTFENFAASPAWPDTFAAFRQPSWRSASRICRSKP